ncbi:hypothetical protein NSA47_02055 [Irregularibacter muris]|uniref:Uncharacterized protein n=1 Tax=Irregularibacter muris TaxID=1796619 RepID=A0AAE3HCU2_9FIRM|nr:hypothetical protein [Irregularibacter muris]MCR1897771.1 hypothetical protein [Irregularibacter muris]
MTANNLISVKKDLQKLQKQLSLEVTKGRYKDTNKIKTLKEEIKEKKLEIGNITKSMISQIVIETKTK